MPKSNLAERITKNASGSTKDRRSDPTVPRIGSLAVPAIAIGGVAIGTAALGAIAIGAIGIGAIAIG